VKFPACLDIGSSFATSLASIRELLANIEKPNISTSVSRFELDDVTFSDDYIGKYRFGLGRPIDVAFKERSSRSLLGSLPSPAPDSFARLSRRNFERGAGGKVVAVVVHQTEAICSLPYDDSTITLGLTRRAFVQRNWSFDHPHGIRQRDQCGAPSSHDIPANIPPRDHI